MTRIERISWELKSDLNQNLNLSIVLLADCTELTDSAETLAAVIDLRWQR